MMLFSIRSKLSDYQVWEGEWGSLKDLINPATDFLIVDDFLAKHHAARLEGLVPPDRFLTVKATERNKTVAYAMKLVERIMSVGITKKSRIVSMGGGIVQDLTGFISSILYRGLEWHFYPTTLLAQTDSCIGAKTSINFKSYKNLLGSFYNPTKVVLIPEFLESLPQRDFLSGLGEIIKLHLIGGPEKVQALSLDAKRLLARDHAATKRALLRALEVKKGFIEEDEFDKGVRNLLNYGHCIGHAIESATHYAVPHGQAVTMGMLLANRLAVAARDLDETTAARVEKGLLVPYIQKKFLRLTLDADAIIAAMKRDKKRVSSDLVVVFLGNEGGVLKRENVKEAEVRKEIDRWNGAL